MSPWWKRRPLKVRVCNNCHSQADIHDGLCRHCRTQLAAKGQPDPARMAPPAGYMPAQPHLEPAHDRPWVHQGGA